MKNTISLAGLTDMIAGDISMIDIDKEIKRYMLAIHKKIIVEIEKKDFGYWATIYVPKKDC